MGGVHGLNRLGGSSLLDCVVFGRVSGLSATRYQLTNALNDPNFGSQSSKAPVSINVDPSGAVRIDVWQRRDLSPSRSTWVPLVSLLLRLKPPLSLLPQLSLLLQPLLLLL